MPIFSDLSSLSLYYAGSSNPYLGSSYSSHSSLLSSSPTFRSPLPSTIGRYGARPYTPHLATIGETSALTSRRPGGIGSSPISRINSPKTRLLSSSTSAYRLSRPVPINTEDIDVSKNRYKHRLLQRNNEFKSSPTSSFVSSSNNSNSYNKSFTSNNENKQTESCDLQKTDLPIRGTIKRGRTVVRFHTKRLKENPYLAKTSSEENVQQDTNNNVQKEINKEDIPSAISPEQLKQEIAFESVSKPNEEEDRLGFEAGENLTNDKKLKEIRRNSAEVLQEHVKLLDVILKQEEIPPQVNLEYPNRADSGRGSVKRKKKPAVKKKLSKDLSTNETENKTPTPVKKVANVSKQTATTVNQIKPTKTKQLIKTSVEVEEKPNFKFTVGDVLVESTTTPTKKKAFTFEVSVEVGTTESNVDQNKSQQQKDTANKTKLDEEKKTSKDIETATNNAQQIVTKQDKLSQKNDDLIKQQTSIQINVQNLERNENIEQTNLKTKSFGVKEVSHSSEINPSIVKKHDIPSTEKNRSPNRKDEQQTQNITPKNEPKPKIKPKLKKEDNFEKDDIDFWETIGKRETICHDKQKQILKEEIEKNNIPQLEIKSTKEETNEAKAPEIKEVCKLEQLKSDSIPLIENKNITKTDLNSTVLETPKIKEICPVSETSSSRKLKNVDNVAMLENKASEMKEICRIPETSHTIMKKEEKPSSKVKETCKISETISSPGKKKDIPLTEKNCLPVWKDEQVSKISENKKIVMKPKEKPNLARTESLETGDVDFWEKIGKRETVRFEKRKEILKEEAEKRFCILLEDSIEKGDNKKLDSFDENSKLQQKTIVNPEQKVMDATRDNLQKPQSGNIDKQLINKVSKITNKIEENENSTTKILGQVKKINETKEETISNKKLQDNKFKGDENKSFPQSKSLDSEYSNTQTSKLTHLKQSKSADQAEKLVADTSKNKTSNLEHVKFEDQKKIVESKNAKPSVQNDSKDQNKIKTPQLSNVSNLPQSKSVDQIVSSSKVSNLTQSKSADQTENKIVDKKVEKTEHVEKQLPKMMKIDAKPLKPVTNAITNAMQEKLILSLKPLETKLDENKIPEKSTVPQKQDEIKSQNKVLTTENTNQTSNRVEKISEKVLKLDEKKVQEKDIVKIQKPTEAKPQNNISTVETKTFGKADTSKIKHSKLDTTIEEVAKNKLSPNDDDKKDDNKEKEIKKVEKSKQKITERDKNTELKTEIISKSEQTNIEPNTDSTNKQDKEKPPAKKEILPTTQEKDQTTQATTPTQSLDPQNLLSNVNEQPLSKIIEIVHKPSESALLNLLLEANNKPRPARVYPKQFDKDDNKDLVLYATPRDLRRPPPRCRQPLMPSFSVSSSSSESDSDSDEDDTSTETEDASSTSDGEESNTVVNEDKRTSTSSNDSGFHSSVPSSPANVNRNHG